MQEKYSKIIGVDVSSEWLDICILPKKKYFKIDNNSKAINDFLKKNYCKNALICYEPTGGYEYNLERSVEKLKCLSFRVHPLKVRNFARSIGILAKNDKLDSFVLASFGNHFGKNTVNKTKEDIELKELSNRRLQLVKEMVSIKNRKRKFHSKEMIKSCEKHLNFLKKEVKYIEKMLKDYIDSIPKYKNLINNLIQIKGIGELSAILIICNMPELGKINRSKISSLAGLAPMSRDSGKKTGKRYIKGGRSNIREILYICSLSASKYNPILAKHYQLLKEKGKASKVALTAIMRKLIILLNSYAKNYYMKYPEHS